MDFWAYLLLILAFLGLFGLIESLIMLAGGRDKTETKRLKERLRIISGELPRLETHQLRRGAYSKNPSVDRFLKQFRRLDGIDSLLRQSGKPYSVAQVLAMMGVLTLMAFLVAIITEPGWISAAAMVVVAAGLPVMALKMLKNTRMKKLEAQLPDALDLLGQSMRAGHAFSSALRTVGTEGPEPIASEFRMTSDEISFGATIREGVLSMATRVDSVDMRYFALAILIQTETGGNLSNLLLDLAGLIRERMKLRRTVQVLAAEGRLSGWILGSLPFLFAALMTWVNPGYLSFFWTDPSGLKIDKYMALLMIVGVLWIRSIINIRV